MNSEVQWWEFSLSIKLMAFVLFSVDDCICVVLVHVRTLKLNEYRADPTQLNGIFFFLLSLGALNWAFRPCAQHLSRRFPGSMPPGNSLF